MLKQYEGLRVTKIWKEIKIEEVWGELESRRTTIHKIHEINCSFHVNK